MARRSIFCILVCCICHFINAQIEFSGLVIDSEEHPMPGATITLVERGLETRTDERGMFVFEGLTEGMLYIRIDYGYLKRQDTLRLTRDVHRTYRLIREIRKDMVVVEATRAQLETPMTKTRINREDIKQRNLGQDVPYMLKWTPSVTVTSDAGTGIGYTGMRIRGSDLTRINVTLNGIPLNDAESQAVFWVDLPDLLSSVDDIQIQRGVGTSTQGAGAFGATVDLNTGLHQSEPYGWISGSYGSFNTHKATVAFGSGMIDNKFSIEGRLSTIGSDGYINRATADLKSYYLSGNYVGDRSSLRFNIISGHERTYQAWYGVPVQYVDDSRLRKYNPAGTEKPGEPYEDQVDDYTQTHYQLLFDQQLADQWKLGLAAHYTRGYGFFEEYVADQSFEYYGLSPIEFGDTTLTETDLARRRWLDNHFYGGIGSLVKTFDAGGRLRIGGGWNRYEGLHYGDVIWAEYLGKADPRHRYYENDALKTDWNVYAKLTWPIFRNGSAFVDLQYRRVNYTFEGLDENGSRVDQSVSLPFFNPKVGLSYDFGEGWSSYASLAVAHKEPNRDDYVETSPVSRQEPEELINLETGADKRGSNYRLGANFYYMFYNDQLIQTGEINDVGAYTRRNVDESYRLGLELQGKWNPDLPLFVESFLTLSKNKIENVDYYIDNWATGDQVSGTLNNTDIPFSPEVNGSVSLGWNWDVNDESDGLPFTLSGALTGKYVGRQYLDIRSLKSASLDPYTYVDGRLEWSTNKGPFSKISLKLMVRNILDAQYSTNGWLYPFKSPDYDPRSDNPYVQKEDQMGESFYHQKGLYPQAGRNVMLGLRIDF